jgi:group I intron endonuclease
MPNPIAIPSVYCILNVENNYRYVGSTGNALRKRKSQHLYSLRHGTHYSTPLQDDYNFYGEYCFRFILLEEVQTYDRAFLYEREQHWIDKYKPEYNTSPTAGDIFPNHVYTEEWRQAIRNRMLGRVQTQEEKDARAESIKEFWRNNPAKTIPQAMREHLSKINTGEGNPNFGIKRDDATRQKQSNGLSYMEYSFIAPDGEIVTFCNLMNPKTDRTDLPSYGALRNIIKYQDKLHNTGWKFMCKRRVK